MAKTNSSNGDSHTSNVNTVSPAKTSTSTNDPSPTEANGGRAAGGGFAAHPKKERNKKKVQLFGEDIANRLRDGPFGPLAYHLETLPKELCTSVEKDATSMLVIVKEIDTKTTAASLFRQTVKSKETGEEVTYQPSCCREIKKKNPVCGSNRIKDSDQYKSIVAKFDELNAEYATRGTALLEECAQLEVSSRKAILQKEVIMSAARLATDLAISRMTMLKVVSPDSIPSFTAKQYGWNVALNFFCYEMKRPWREACYFESSDQFGTFVDALTAEQGDDIITEKDAEFADDTDKAIDHTVSKKFNIMFPLMTFEAWKTIRTENVIRSVNQQIAVARSNKEQGEINQETEEQITKDVPLDKKTMFSYFKEWSKIDVRKNSLGDPKNQGSPSTKPGRNTGKPSGKPKGRSKGNLKAPQVTFKLSRKQQQQQHKQQLQQQRKQQQRKRQENLKSNPKSNKRNSNQRQPPRGKGNQGDARSAKGKKSRHFRK